MDRKLEKKIDTLYRNTKQMPVIVFCGLVVPFVLIVGSALGLLYWFSRRRLLKGIDSGRLVIDSSVPPPLIGLGKIGDLSTPAKVDYIRKHKHTLLVPSYLLVVLAVLLGTFIGYMVMNDTRL